MSTNAHRRSYKPHMAARGIINGTLCQVMRFGIGLSSLVDELNLQKIFHSRLDFLGDMAIGAHSSGLNAHNCIKAVTRHSSLLD